MTKASKPHWKEMPEDFIQFAFDPNGFAENVSSMIRLKEIYKTVIFAAVAICLSSCKSPTISEPKRTGIEQLLLSQAVDEAVMAQEIPQVKGKKLYVSEEYLESYDSRYVAGTIRALLSENGGYLVDDREDAEIIIEARSGALGIDSSSTLIGLPSIPIIIPTAGTISLPNLALYEAERADSVTKLSLLAYEADGGAPVFSSEPYKGQSHFHKYTILFLFTVNFTDIPERKRY